MSEHATRSRFFDLIGENPCIAGIKDDAGLRQVLGSECKIVFVLYGNIVNLHAIVKKLKEHGKMAFVNVDLIDGFAAKDVVVDYVKEHTQIDGLLSSKASIVKAAKSQGLLAIHRFFVIDSFSYHNLVKQAEISKPSIIEILPGCMPKVISWVLEAVRLPIIAGGLVCDHEEAMAALKAGASAISSTNPNVWTLRRKANEAPPSAERKGRPVIVELRHPVAPGRARMTLG